MNGQRYVEEGGARAPGEARERLLAVLPVMDRRVQVAGVSTAVLEGGDGPPVLLLHSSGEFAALWMRVIPPLVTTHRVVAPTCPVTAPRRLLTARWTSTACSHGSGS